MNRELFGDMFRVLRDAQQFIAHGSDNVTAESADLEARMRDVITRAQVENEFVNLLVAAREMLDAVESLHDDGELDADDDNADPDLIAAVARWRAAIGACEGE